jgi:ABC-type sugar transport system substrate-binding protein
MRNGLTLAATAAAMLLSAVAPAAADTACTVERASARPWMPQARKFEPLTAKPSHTSKTG